MARIKCIAISILLVVITSGCGAHTGAPAFAPAQELTCTGSITEWGRLCDFSDGKSFSRHDSWRVSTRSDGHGTFQVVSETGISGTGLRQINFDFPTPVDILEVHGELSITSWCDNNGAMSTWTAFSDQGLSDIVGGKTFSLKDKETISWTVGQTTFSPALPVKTLQQNIFADLCARSTIHWVFNGSF